MVLICYYIRLQIMEEHLLNKINEIRYLAHSHGYICLCASTSGNRDVGLRTPHRKPELVTVTMKSEIANPKGRLFPGA